MIERYYGQDLVESFGSIFVVLLIIFALGFVVLWEPDPVPVPVNETLNNSLSQPEVYTLEPTPVPVVTEDPIEYMVRTNGLPMREWHNWFRPDVEGINRTMDTGDLATHVTVYGYRFMPSYHYWSVSWAQKFLVKPDDKADQFLFVLVNMYSDGDDVRQYGMDYNHFSVQIGDRIYQPDFIEFPERRITELDEVWDYAHVDSVIPYGFKIVQEAGSGIITAEKFEWLMTGRSNAWDGFIVYQVPYNVTAKDVKVLGNFGTLGGQVWWQLK